MTENEQAGVALRIIEHYPEMLVPAAALPIPRPQEPSEPPMPFPVKPPRLSPAAKLLWRQRMNRVVRRAS